MKSTDYALILFIAIISIIVSYLVGNAVLGDPSDKVEELTYVKEVDSMVADPDQELFNPYNINPTQEVYVGRCKVGEVFDPNTSMCRNIDGSAVTPDTPDEPDKPETPDTPDEPDKPTPEE